MSARIQTGLGKWLSTWCGRSDQSPPDCRHEPYTARCAAFRIATMDYDQTEIAAAYDKARGLAPETARLWLELLSAYIDPTTTSLIVDLGCGTGRFSDLLAAHFRVQVIGIDPSSKMIDQACRKPVTGAVTYRRAS